ncbi:MAG TPA: MFS transporter, partial [Victivallales bacterium]|nr:MFS transporter [Victivallales bacterium]
VLFIFVIIANKYGKGYAYRIGALLWLISLFMVFTISPGASITSVIMHFTFMGIGLSPCYMIPWAVLPSVIDVDELITSKQRSGTYAGAMTLLRKISQGLIVLPSIGIILSIIHYVPDHAQTPQVLFDLRIVFILVPLFLVAVGFLFALRFKITPKTHAMLKSEIMRLRNGGEKENVEPVIKETCETLTGLKYENLYDESNTYLKKRKKKIFA